jgi:DNA polymerase I-like protein with 3'-5' exonuclease and polymerase domains
MVTTFYGMEIPADNHHALSYLIQSTFGQLALRQMIKVFNFLKDRKSFIAFTIHDNIVIDLAEEDKKDLKKIINVFSNTDLGMFKVNVKAGNNYGEMRKI